MTTTPPNGPPSSGCARYASIWSPPCPAMVTVSARRASDIGARSGSDLGRRCQGVEGGKRGAPGTGHVQIGYEREGRHPRLLLAQRRVGPHLVQEPVAEPRRRLDDAATDEVGRRVGEVGGDGEQPAQRHRLLLEDG